MTLEQWSIVQNSILLVLFILYGLWQKHIKDDLFKSKDTAIQTLEAIIKAKDAQISALQADTAPVIAQAYNTLKKYVREVTAESQLHAEQIKQTSKELTDVRDELDKERRTSGVQIKLRNETVIASGLLGQAQGLTFARNFISSRVSDSFNSMKAPPSDVDTLIDALTNLANTIEHTIEQLDTECDNKRLETKKLLDSINNQMES